MPKGPSGEKRPADVIGAAVKVMRIATGEEEEKLPARSPTWAICWSARPPLPRAGLPLCLLSRLARGGRADHDPSRWSHLHRH